MLAVSSWIVYHTRLFDGLKFRRFQGIMLNKIPDWRMIMAKVCQVTGKRPVAGNNVSHAKNRTRRRFLPNLHSHRFWVESENRWVKLKLTAKAIRTIDKVGIDAVLADMRKRGETV